MVDPQKLMNDLSAEAKAEQAVDNLRDTLRETSSEKSRDAEASRQKGSLADTAEEKQAFNEQADFLDKEAVAYKEEATKIDGNKEQYVKHYIDINETEQPLEENTFLEPEKEELESAEQEEEQAEAEADFEPTAGDQIKDVFPDEGLLDKAFAEMLGNIADRIQEAVKAPEQEQER